MTANMPAATLSLFGCCAISYGSLISRDHNHGHEGDVVVGRTGAGQTAVQFDFGETIGLPPVSGLLTGWAADGDFDEDRDVDTADHAAFAVCLSGSEVRPQPADPTVTTCEVDCHNAFDFDDDLDTDLLDFAEFQIVFDP